MARTTRHRGIVGATLTGLVDRLRSVGQRRVAAPEDRLDGQTALVTGASRGLGLGIAIGLAERGAKVILACRSRQEEAPAEVRAAVPGAEVLSLGVELTDFASVDALADALKAHAPLDRVVLNAGVVSIGKRSEAGLDRMMHVNWLANVQLTRRLLADGTVAARPGRPTPRIVVVGSDSHRSADLVDIPALLAPESYGIPATLTHYGRSKLLLHVWAAELSRRLDDIEVHHLCPGAVDSHIAREAPAGLLTLLKPVFRLGFQSPATAAEPVIYLAASPDLDGQTGLYLHVGVQRDPDPRVLDPEVGAQVWDDGLALLDQLS